MIFARFMAIYGHKFKSCFESENEIRLAKREWALSLSGYSEAELVAAINRCKETLAWMPTVSEFIAILNDLNGDYGLPAVRTAYIEACMNADKPSAHHWSHRAIYHAGRATGWFRLRSEEERQVLPDFRYNYEVICRRVRAGEELDEPVPVALENKSDDTLAAFIRQWSESQSVDEVTATKLLYFMTKPKGSRTRAKFKALAQKQLLELKLPISLPDDYQ